MRTIVNVATRGPIEVVYDMIGVSHFVFNVKMILLHICRQLMITIILQLPLCLYKLKRLVIGVDDHLLPHNVVLQLSVSLHDGINLIIISGVLLNCIENCLTLISHSMLMLGEDYTNSII